MQHQVLSNHYSFIDRGTDDVISPHGIPVDLLDRLLIIRTIPYTREEVMVIVTIRAKTESILIEETAVEALGDIGVKTSLRFLQL